MLAKPGASGATEPGAVGSAQSNPPPTAKHALAEPPVFASALSAHSAEESDSPMDVRLRTTTEERLLLLERARQAWETRPLPDAEEAARWLERTRRAHARFALPPGGERALVVGGGPEVVAGLAAWATYVVVVELSSARRASIDARSREQGFGHVRAEPFAHLLHAAVEAPSFERVYVFQDAFAATAPPVADEFLRMGARLLRAGGTMYCEWSSWRAGYAWRASRALRGQPVAEERHILPARQVFASLTAECCALLDVCDLPPLHDRLRTPSGSATVAERASACLAVKAAEVEADRVS